MPSDTPSQPSTTVTDKELTFGGVVDVATVNCDGKDHADDVVSDKNGVKSVSEFSDEVSMPENYLITYVEMEADVFAFALSPSAVSNASSVARRRPPRLAWVKYKDQLWTTSPMICSQTACLRLVRANCIHILLRGSLKMHTTNV